MPVYNRYNNSDGTLAETRFFVGAPSTVGSPVKGFVWVLQDKPALDNLHTVAWDASTRAWVKTAKSLADLKAAKLDALSAKFRQERDKGTTITISSTDYAVGTTHDVRQELRDLREKVTPTGTQKIVTRAGAALTANLAIATALYNAVEAHIAACCANEYDHTVAINALDDEQDVIDYDITTGWPS